MNYNPRWLGVDFDRTLVEYHEWRGGNHIGLPIWPMVNRVKQEMEKGRNVRIFTARVSGPDPATIMEQVRLIQAWCVQYLGRTLPVTCKKDRDCEELWDDIAKGVQPNKGEFV